VRSGEAGAGGSLPGVVGAELAAFNGGLEAFQEVDGVARDSGHASISIVAPAATRSLRSAYKPKLNPQIAMATAMRANNTIPWFLSSDGPIREVRFRRNPDGSPDAACMRVHISAGRMPKGAT